MNAFTLPTAFVLLDSLLFWQIYGCLLSLLMAYMIWLNARHRELALTDRLTQIQSRLAGELALEKLEKRRQGIRRRRRWFPRLWNWWQALVVVVEWDIDKFKDFNTLHGHAGGDHVLKQVAGVIQNQLRKGDSFSRPGGEEMRALMPGLTLEEGWEVAERIRLAVADSVFHYDGKELRVTISAGVGLFTEETPMHGVVKKANRAMNRAKVQGRNRTEWPSARRPEDLDQPTQ